MRIVKGPGTVTWLFVAISAIYGGTQWTSAAPPDEITLAIPGRTNATPWIASTGSFVAVVWAASASGKGDVFIATSRDGGSSFDAPVRVNAIAGDARISGEIAPRVSLRSVAGAPPEIAVTWNARDTGTAIRTARSKDGGRTFSAPRHVAGAGRSRRSRLAGVGDG